MEEKKNEKTEGTKKNKSRHGRRHGYFIEPPTEGSANPEVTPKAADTKGQSGGNANNSRKAQGEGQGTHHQKQRHKQHKPQQSEQKAEVYKEDAQSQSKPENSQSAQGKKKNNRSRNKNRHKSHTSTQSNGEQAATATVAQQPSQPRQKAQEKSSPSSARGRTQKYDLSAHASHSADDYEEYKLTVPDEEPRASKKKPAKENNDEDAPKTEVVGIRFKSTGKVYYFDPKGRKLTKGSKAIVDTARGQEFGEVAMSNSLVSDSDIVPPLRAVIRGATTADIEHHKSNKEKENEAFRVCNEKIKEHKLEMKLIDAQYTFDNSKLLFYFTSSDRVDFRDLVKDLASVFHTRIELRQIGIRDEAKLMGGLGMCGRPLCCTLFLSDFDQVSIKMAKEQNLSLNSAKISGICGRLMCCLKYEHEAYEYEIKRTPPVDSLVRTENGDGVVTEISPLKGTVKVRLLASPDTPPKTYHRDTVTMLRKKSPDKE